MSRIYGVELAINVGGWLFQRVPRCIVTYDRNTVLSRAEIHVPDPAGKILPSLHSFPDVSISMGYRNQQPHIWNGTVDGWQQGTGKRKDQLVIHAAGVELPLVTQTVKEMWVDEAAPAIAKKILQASGLAVGAVDVPAEVIPRMTLATVPVWQAIEQLRNTLVQGHDVDMSQHALWVDADKRVHFAPADHESETVPVIATGVGLIRHTPARTVNGLGEVETFLLPTMRAGMRFKLEDSRKGITGVFRAKWVMHSIKPDRVRTFLSK